MNIPYSRTWLINILLIYFKWIVTHRCQDGWTPKKKSTQKVCILYIYVYIDTGASLICIHSGHSHANIYIYIILYIYISTYIYIPICYICMYSRSPTYSDLATRAVSLRPIALPNLTQVRINQIPVILSPVLAAGPSLVCFFLFVCRSSRCFFTLQ